MKKIKKKETGVPVSFFYMLRAAYYSLPSIDAHLYE